MIVVSQDITGRPCDQVLISLQLQGKIWLILWLFILSRMGRWSLGDRSLVFRLFNYASSLKNDYEKDSILFNYQSWLSLYMNNYILKMGCLEKMIEKTFWQEIHAVIYTLDIEVTCHWIYEKQKQHCKFISAFVFNNCIKYDLGMTLLVTQCEQHHQIKWTTNWK